MAASSWSQTIPAFRRHEHPDAHGRQRHDIHQCLCKGSLPDCSASVRPTAPWTAQENWNNKACGYMSTPVVIDGHVYLHLQNQRFTCIDLASGKTALDDEALRKILELGRPCRLDPGT